MKLLRGNCSFLNVLLHARYSLCMRLCEWSDINGPQHLNQENKYNIGLVKYDFLVLKKTTLNIFLYMSYKMMRWPEKLIGSHCKKFLI